MANPTAVFETSAGTFKAEIFVDEMPITGANFVKLAKDGFYDGLHFHRVIKNFMIQFGCPYSQGPGKLARRHRRAAARHHRRRTPREARSSRTRPARCQWPTPAAPTAAVRSSSSTPPTTPTSTGSAPGASKHPVFGKITDGMDVVTAIGTTKTAAGDRPVTPIMVKHITIEE